MGSGSYSVRHAADTDLVVVARLVHGDPALNEDELTATQWAAWSKMMSADNQTLYLAEDADGVVASVQARRCTT